MNAEEDAEDAEVTEAAEALEVSSIRLAATDATPSDEESCDIARSSGPLFRLSEVEQVIQQYGKCIEKFQISCRVCRTILQFDQAREIIEQYTQSSSKSMIIINEKDVSLAALLSSLVMLANCDKSYYFLSFLQPKAFFRKENALKNQYYQISEKLVRASSSTPRSENESSSTSEIEQILTECRQYVLARVEMISIFTTIASLGEIDVLLLLVSAQMHIANCKASRLALHVVAKFLFQMFESLLQLKEIRERFDFWIRDAHCLNPVNKSVFYFFRSNEKLPRNRLINWLIQFYNLLMAKFSLYFTNVLANFCSVDDLKTVHTIDNGFNFISNATQFVKKTDAICLAIVMDREKCSDSFYGFGYHRLKDRFTPGPPTEPRKGVAALCPAVFRLPSPTEGHKSAQSHNDIFERCQENIYEFIESNLRHPVRNKYFYDPVKDHCMFGDNVEAELYIVVVYAGRVCEKDAAVLAFIQQMTTSLRGSRLFLSLKNAAK
ncbi:unnamed protein product [Cylicostephanus goldi]|uniref:Uncharacterized protein n=1 Tax=Cylicostephanus goldi TaxID=71465 RepID=A0A3P6QFJ8_CYLGO|nr:unnamed protein product [Cylicostephanus goldi]